MNNNTREERSLNKSDFELKVEIGQFGGNCRDWPHNYMTHAIV
jgi:hypothetical protein